MNSNKKIARTAGILYLVVAVFSAFSMMYVDPKFFVPGDAATTVSNILASEWLFRLGFVSNLVAQVVFLFLVYTFYNLFKSVDKDTARLMVILVVASVPIAFLNMLNQFAPILLLSGSAYLSAFQPVQLQAMAMFFLEMQKAGILIVGVFWGIWLFPLGILVVKSGFIPKWIGIFVLIAGAGYVVDSLGKFLFSNFNIVISMFTFIGEILLILWLLIIGVKEQKPVLKQVA
ncbi:MAG: hypothetical protein A2Y33_03500 [Spirochaetes bacterium GWF1_51_8]|nr:MAG: hypothetical protein A2Y33_03500 [Spirochaetes bacterium GWF1_51_8]